MSRPTEPNEPVDIAVLARKFVREALSGEQVNELISQVRDEAQKKFGRDFSDPAFDE